MSLTLEMSAGPSRKANTRGTVRARNVALALLAFALVAVAAPGDVAFAPPAISAVGVNPRSIAAGDYNEDGKLDAVVANFNSSSVSTLLGNGNGTFGPATNLPVGVNPAAVLLVNLNNDTHLDIAVANFSSNTVSIRLGGGTAVFGPVVNYPAGSLPMAMAAGDFDDDGDEDLAVANFSANTISRLRNNGDGSFAAPTAFAVGINPRALVACDFNGDDKLDLATANDLSNNVSVLLGNGDGTFAAAANFGAGFRPFALAAGDFNGDNHLDLVTGNQTSGNVSILMGSGNGTFAAAVNIPAGMPVLSVAAADFNGDSKLDLAFGSTVSNMLMVLPGNGNGTFQAVKMFAAGGPVNALAVGDWTGDNMPDVAAAHPATATFAVLVNTSTPPVTNQPPTVDAGMDQSAECAGPSGVLVQLSGTASDPDGDTLTYSWTDENGNVVGLVSSVQVQVPFGMHTFTLTVDDGHGNTASDTVMVTVGDSMAPSLNLMLTPTTLWPANGAMVEVTAALAAGDTCDAAVSVTLVSITSSEPDSGLGNGDLPNDVQDAAFGTDDRSFLLRAERSGKGPGRVYTVRYSATDAAGNSASVEGQVFVPHDNGVRGKPNAPGQNKLPRR